MNIDDTFVNLIKRSGILIPRTYENTSFYQSIKEHLTRRSQDYTKSVLIVNEFFLESEKFMLIPRYFPIQKYIHSFSVSEKSHRGMDIKIEHNIKPRSETQEKAINFMLRSESGILQLPPGVGKTVISIYMIAERKKKSLILVHRDSLADQWRDRILSFTNLNEKDVVRLTSTTFKEDLKKPIIIMTTQTFVSLLKRKRKEFLIALDSAGVGVFIADEVHTSVGAPTFSECSIHMPCKYTYGLSATPYRWDGNGDIIEYHLGEIFEDEDSKDTMDARVTAILLDYQIDTPRRHYYVRWGGEFQRARYLNLMKKSEPFRKTLKGLLNKLQDDRDLICMAERIKLIEEVYKETNHPSKSKFCGNAKLDALEEKVVFATPGKCRDGIDAPQKDCVITTSPISNIEQLTGRIVRPQPGKKTPIVIDMIDFGCEDISRTFHNRLKFYDRREWPVKFLMLGSDGGVHEIVRETAIQIIKGDI